LGGDKVAARLAGDRIAAVSQLVNFCGITLINGNHLISLAMFY